MEVLFSIALFTSVIADTPSVYLVDDTGGAGRQFDGVGAISGGGATSKLLVTYQPQIRDQILDFLFKPNFGASLQILKVEIGGDAQSTDGSEASHMHYSWDENYNRGYEWWLMMEAKKRNPNIKLYALPWGFPGWVGGNSTDNPWGDPELPVKYVTNWIKGAKSVHNLTIDYIGIWNERMYSVPYIKLLRKTLDEDGFGHVVIVGADKKWEIADDILADPILDKAVDVIGCHYPGTLSDASALKTGKPLWASEDYSTFNNGTGGGCWARILNMNHVNGNMTATISWNLIASYYEGLPYFRDGLMTAAEPWSGHYAVNSPIWMTAHTTQFTAIGWRYLRHGVGVGNLTGGGSYVTLVSPDNKHVTIVIETMSHDNSVCIRPYLPPFDVQPQNVTFQLKGTFAATKTINVWRSRLSSGHTSAPELFLQLNPLTVVNGVVSLNLGVDEVYTLTTLTSGQKGDYPTAPASKPFPLTYGDGFETYPEHAEPDFLSQQTGAYEVLDVGPPHHKVLRQMVLAQPVHWCGAERKANKSLNIIGSSNWTNILLGVQARVVNATCGYFLAARVDRGGCHSDAAQGIFLFFFPSDNSFILANDFQRKKIIRKGKLQNSDPTGWNTIEILITSTDLNVRYNYQLLFDARVPVSPKNGFAAIGTDSWCNVDFDDIKIDSSF